MNAAERERAQHARFLGVPLDGDVTAAIQHAELTRGIARDPRVAPADMERAIRRAEQALAMVPAPQRALFGFTRVVDAKVAVTVRLVEALASSCGDGAALAHAIDVGPGNGDLVWVRPSTPIELVASLVRQIVLGAGASRQLTVGDDLAAWVHTTIENVGAPVSRAMGGAGAFAANIGAAVGITSSFFSTDKLPRNIVERFAPGVWIVDGTGHRRLPTTYVSDAPARINTSAEYAAGTAFTVCGRRSVSVNGVDRDVVAQGSGRVILGTQGGDVTPGFGGVPDAALERIALQTDLFFFAGIHHLTRGRSEDARQAAADLARSLSWMKAAHPRLLCHAQYVVPKVPENEAIVLRALVGKLDSLALNSVEVPMLVGALERGELLSSPSGAAGTSADVESAPTMLAGALAVKDALGLKRVHVHGLGGDLVISAPGMPGEKNPERQTLALLKARQLAANKAANDSGEIKTREDIWPLVPAVRGTALAELHRIADALSERGDVSDDERARVVEHWWCRLPRRDEVLHYVPSRGIHDHTGGTVSLGDTIDSVALMFALEPDAP